MSIEINNDPIVTAADLEAVATTRRRGRAAAQAFPEPSLVEPVHDVYGLNDKAEALAFNEEPVEIFLHETTNPNEENWVFIGVNGETKWLERGKAHVLKRKFVEQLSRAKPSNIRTIETRGADGGRAIEVRKHTALKYPFDIVRDENPKGARWARQLRAAA